MSYTKEQEAALRDLENASKAIRTAKSPKVEAEYGAAYRKAVACGVRPKLKARYNH
jgi:hypothetical protein